MNTTQWDCVVMASVDRWSLYRGVLVSLRWSMDQSTVVSVDRWSLYRGVLVSLRWSMDQSTVVSVDRWSFCLPMYLSRCMYLYLYLYL